MSLSPREISAAVARSTQQRAKPLRATTGAALTKGYLSVLKARRAEVGIWEIRGKVFTRVLAYSRDAKLSGAETHVLGTIAMHLHHMGRSKGMMTVGSLADDCMVDARTIRNVLRVLAACGFLTVRWRLSGQMTVTLDKRFGPRTPVPGNKSAERSPRRCAPRKKISTNGNSSRCEELPLKDECKDSAARTARAESTASAPRASTATGTGWLACSICSAEISGPMVGTGNGRSFAHRTCFAERGTGPPGHDPPRKRV